MSKKISQYIGRPAHNKCVYQWSLYKFCWRVRNKCKSQNSICTTVCLLNVLQNNNLFHINWRLYGQLRLDVS